MIDTASAGSVSLREFDLSRQAKERTVDDIVGQADAASVRANGHALLGSHEQHGEDLVDARETARVDLADVDRVRREELLEAHPVVRVLAGGCRSRRREESVSSCLPVSRVA